MRRGMAGRGSSDRAPIAVTQRGEADVKAAMRAQGSRDRPNLLKRCQSGDRGVGSASGLTPGAERAEFQAETRSVSGLPGKRVRAGDDFEDLLRDLGLARPVQ